MEIRCCCTPENLIGHVSMQVGMDAGLKLRELDDGSHAFSSEDRQDIDQIPGLIRFRSVSRDELLEMYPDAPVDQRDNRKGGKKTWRKK